MSSYNPAKLTKLAALKALAMQNKSTVDTLDSRVGALEQTGAQANIIEGVKVNGVPLTLTDKTANVLISEGSTNGTVRVNNADVAVHGLSALAYKASVALDDLVEALRNMVTRGNNAAAAVDTLNGEGDGSITKMIDDAFNDFATKITDDSTVNSYKELIDWVAEHGPQAAEMAAGISANETAIHSLRTLVGELPEEAASATIVGYIAEAVNALASGDYATTANVTEAISTALENYHTKSEFEAMIATDEEVAAMLNEVYGVQPS